MFAIGRPETIWISADSNAILQDPSTRSRAAPWCSAAPQSFTYQPYKVEPGLNGQTRQRSKSILPFDDSADIPPRDDGLVVGDLIKEKMILLRLDALLGRENPTARARSLTLSLGTSTAEGFVHPPSGPFRCRAMQHTRSDAAQFFAFVTLAPLHFSCSCDYTYAYSSVHLAVHSKHTASRAGYSIIPSPHVKPHIRTVCLILVRS